MPDHNFNVKVLVDVQGKKVMDDLAKGAGTSSPATTGTTTGSGERGVGSTLQSLIGAITPLTAAIGVGVGILGLALANSQVLSKIMGTVGKMLGFMLDIVLLPLMPLIMGLMRFMWSMILAFKGWDQKLQEKGFLGVALDITPVGPAYELARWLLPWLFVENKGEGSGKVNINLFGVLGDAVMEWFYGFGNVWDITVNFLKNIPGVQWLLDLIADVKQFLFPASAGTEEGASSSVVNENWFKPQYKGGYSAKMEAQAAASNSNNTFNFYGVTPEDMIRQIRDLFAQMAQSSTLVW